jgi:LysR family transcriptional regulator (chromosome initiation inhibitor)
MIEIRELASLRAVVIEGSFDAGARAMFITPGAMSQRIKQLEGKVGQVLVLRTQPPTLTAAGETMLQLAQQVELLRNEAMKALGGDGESTGETVVLAVNHDSLATWFLPSIADFVQRNEMKVDLRVHESEHTHRLLRQGLAIAAVTSEVVPVQGCKATPLGALRYVAVASRDFIHAWFGAGFVAEAYAAAPLVAFDRADGLAHQFLRRHVRRILAPPVHFVPTSAELILAARLGMGWCMAPRLMVEPLIANGELVRLEPAAEVRTTLFWQTWNLKSKLVQGLTRAVLGGAREWLGERRTPVSPSVSAIDG